MNVEQRILSRAGHLIGANLTGAVVLRRGPRNLVLQARTRSATGPGEVVIKAALGPEDLLGNERAALQFLSLGAITRTFVPRLLASSPDAGILVMEHVPGGTLEALLGSAARDDAAHAVTATARTLGILHAATVGREEEWAARAGGGRNSPAEQAEAFRELVPAIVRFCERAGITLPPTFRDELGIIANGLERPLGWLAFTLGDLAPSNVILAAAGPVFVDLEYAEFRHAGYDAAFWHAICPFPERVAEQADRAYFAGWAEVGGGPAGAPTGKECLEQTARMAAHRAFWSLTWNAGKVWESDFEEMPGVSARRLRRLWLRGFGRLARRAGALPTLTAVAHALDMALGRRWPETNAPAVLFPAFGALA